MIKFEILNISFARIIMNKNSCQRVSRKAFNAVQVNSNYYLVNYDLNLIAENKSNNFCIS